MPLLTRRNFMLTGAAALAGVAGAGSWAFALEPGFMLNVTSYDLDPAGWPAGLRLKVVVIADIHACEPWMSAERIRHICDVANALQPDVIVLLGDYQAGMRMVTAPVYPDEWGEAMSVPRGAAGRLRRARKPRHLARRPAGRERRRGRDRHPHAGSRGRARARQRRRAREQGRARRVDRRASPTRCTTGIAPARRWIGRDDLEGTLKRVTDDAPVILLAHEPFIFPRVPARVTLTLCGHTHGGQVMLPFIGNPLLLRRVRAGHAYGHVIEDGRHMIVSAGLGTSIVPARFMRPPEIVQINLGIER